MFVVRAAFYHWKRFVRLLGNFQAMVILSIVYIFLLPWVAIPYRLLSDPLRIKHRQAAFTDVSEVERATMAVARKQ